MDQTVPILWLQCRVAAEPGTDSSPKQYLADITYWQPGWEQLPYTALKRGGKCYVLCAAVVCSWGRSEKSYPGWGRLPSLPALLVDLCKPTLLCRNMQGLQFQTENERKVLATDFIHLIGFAATTQMQHLCRMWKGDASDQISAPPCTLYFSCFLLILCI